MTAVNDAFTQRSPTIVQRKQRKRVIGGIEGQDIIAGDLRVGYVCLRRRNLLPSASSIDILRRAIETHAFTETGLRAIVCTSRGGHMRLGQIPYRYPGSEQRSSGGSEAQHGHLDIYPGLTSTRHLQGRDAFTIDTAGYAVTKSRQAYESLPSACYPPRTL